MEFFDDFEWEDMAIAGSFAEEMFEEERRWRHIRKEDGDDFFDDDLEDDFFERRRPSPSCRRRKPAPQPFEQWLHDYLHGRKKLTDPLYGPPRSDSGEGANLVAGNKAVILGVPLFNAQLVSERFLHFIYIILSIFPKHGLNAVIFSDAGHPVVDGREVFGTFDAGDRSICLSLKKFLANGLCIMEHGHTGFSIRHIIWDASMRVFLHEIKHALDTRSSQESPLMDRDEQDRIADAWVCEVLTILAQNGHLEPPEPFDDPYFGPRVIHHLERAIETGNWIWAKEQKEMLNEGIIYRKLSEGMEIRSEKQFYALSSAGLADGEQGRFLNALVLDEQQKEKEAWDRDDMCTDTVREAISSGRRLRIEYLESEGCVRTHTVVPVSLFSEWPFQAVGARSEPGDRYVTFRIDRITCIAIL